MARLIQSLIETSHACAYLPSEVARNELLVLADISPGELEVLLEQGWRRFGAYYFRPACERCFECVSIRVDVARFRPSPSQRRVKKNVRRFRYVVSVPTVDASRLLLYERWHRSREVLRGWQSNLLDEERYAQEFALPHPAARELSCFDGDRLIGVGLFDETPHALSAVYFYSEPDYAKYSLGTANVLSLLEQGRERGKAYLYLGYRVIGCPSLQYKEKFTPHELLFSRPNPGDAAAWLKEEDHCNV